MIGLIIFGEKGSGKDTVARLINEYSERSVSFFNIGDLVRHMSCIFLATDKWKENKREFYIDTSVKLKEIDENFLSYYVLGRILEKFKKESLSEIDKEQLIIITGGRTYEDYYYWTKQGFKTLGIKCNEEIREARLKNRDGYEQKSIDNLEKDTKKIIEMCEYNIDNSGTYEELEREITNFVIKKGF